MGGSNNNNNNNNNPSAPTRDPPPPISVVPYLSIFRYCEAYEWTLITVGTIAAVAGGAALPFFSVLLGEVITAFGTRTSRVRYDPRPILRSWSLLLLSTNPHTNTLLLTHTHTYTHIHTHTHTPRSLRRISENSLTDRT